MEPLAKAQPKAISRSPFLLILGLVPWLPMEPQGTGSGTIQLGSADRWTEWMEPFEPFREAQGSDIYAQMLMDWLDGTTSHTGRIHQRAPREIFEDPEVVTQVRVDVLGECARQAATAGRYRQAMAAIARARLSGASPDATASLWEECAALLADAPRLHHIPPAFSRKATAKMPSRRVMGGDGPQAYLHAWAEWKTSQHPDTSMTDVLTELERSKPLEQLSRWVEEEDIGRAPLPAQHGSGAKIEILGFGGRSNATKWMKSLNEGGSKVKRLADHVGEVDVPLDRWMFDLHHDQVSKRVGNPDVILLFRGVLVPPEPGLYKLQAMGDDGLLVFLGGELCLDSWTGPVMIGETEMSVYDKYFQTVVQLEAPITIDFALFDTGGSAALTFDALQWVKGGWKNSSTDIRLRADAE